MNETRHLDRLWQAAQKRYRRLRADALVLAKAPAEQGIVKRGVPLLVIDGINSWANFARSFYLSSALGCRNQRGHEIIAKGATFATQRDAIDAAIRAAAKHNVPKLPLFGPIDRRLEPAWSDPNALIQAGSAVHLSNQPDVVNAFSPFPGFIADWACVRNFFAHRNHDTYTSARTVLTRHGVVLGSDVADWMLRAGLTSGRPLLVEWCIEIELRCEYLCA